MQGKGHVAEIRTLAVEFSNFSGLAFDTSGTPVATFANNTKSEIISLDLDQARSVLTTLAKMRSSLPGLLPGDPYEGRALNALPKRMRAITRTNELNIAMQNYMRGFDQLARAVEAMETPGHHDGRMMKPLEHPSVPVHMQAAVPKVVLNPSPAWRKNTIRRVFSENGPAAALFKTLKPGASYRFVMFGQPFLQMNILEGEQSGPSADVIMKPRMVVPSFKRVTLDTRGAAVEIAIARQPDPAAISAAANRPFGAAQHVQGHGPDGLKR